MRQRDSYDLASQRCNIYYYDVHAATGVAPLPSSKIPKSWSENHRYATEYWLANNLRVHPWRVASIAQADVIFIAATFAQACHSGKNFYGRKLWQALLQDESLWPNGTFLPRSKERERLLRADVSSDWGPPKALNLQYPACPPWVDNNRTAYVPRDAFLLSEYVPSHKTGFASRGIVSPFVVATPRWLAGAPLPLGHSTVSPTHHRDSSSSSAAARHLALLEQSDSPHILPWNERRLVFFVGHLPKVHIARARFDVWRQIRNDPRATTKSHSGNCTIGSYVTCRMHDPAALRTQPNQFFMRRCHDWCGGHAQAIKTGLTCGASEHRTQAENYKRMAAECKPYLRRNQASPSSEIGDRRGNGSAGNRSREYAVDLSPRVLSDLHRDAAKRWTEREYLERAMGHKFCLVVQGDFPGTPKIAEMLAMGGAGGCVPVFVLKLHHRAEEALWQLGASASASSQPSRADINARRALEAIVEQGLATAVRASLPYSRWLDYCTVSILVSERKARHNASGLLDVLDAWPVRFRSKDDGKRAAGSVLERRQNLRRIRHAFGFWANSSIQAPSATDYIFAEVCAHARRFRGHFRTTDAAQVLSKSNLPIQGQHDFKGMPPHAVAGSSNADKAGLRRCLLQL